MGTFRDEYFHQKGNTVINIKPEKQDLVFTRLFDAPIEEVWKAWSDPEYVKQWWGPNGFTAPLARMDFRQGGTSLVCRARRNSGTNTAPGFTQKSSR
jgi:uncharacterized protein YndB with AHSA1/START domain